MFLNHEDFQLPANPPDVGEMVILMFLDRRPALAHWTGSEWILCPPEGPPPGEPYRWTYLPPPLIEPRTLASERWQ